MRMFTVRDSRIQKLNHDAIFEEKQRRAFRADLEQRIARWEAKVAEFGGKVHIETLARLRAQLANLK